MRRAIIHIGTPRTGTTSFQAILSGHRNELSRAGLLYPDLTPRSAMAPHLSHQYLGEAFDGRRPRHERNELLTTLDAALTQTNIDVVVLSYEGLCLLPAWRRAPVVLADLFARRGFSMEVLLTVKAQALYAQSQYTWRCQFLREKQFFADSLSRDLRRRRYNYNAVPRIWRRAPISRFHVVPVHDRRSDAPLIKRIFTQLELADRVGHIVTAADFSRFENRSPGPVAVEVSRRLRERGVVSTNHAHARAITDFVAGEARAHGLDTEPFWGLDSDMVERVTANFAASNERFGQSAWGESWSQRVAIAPLAPVNVVGARTLNDTLARHLEEITTAACERFGLNFGTGLNSFFSGFVRRPRT